MPQFDYIVRTKDGAREEGTIDADNINIASEKLSANDSAVINFLL